jgi:hypothetical protein
VEVASVGTRQGIVLMVHVLALLPIFFTPSLPMLLLLPVVTLSLLFHFRHLEHQRWRGVLLLSDGCLRLLDRSSADFPGEFLGCSFCGSQLVILRLRVTDGEVCLPVFRAFQKESFRRMRCWLAKSVARDMPIGRRRDTGSVF